MESYKEEYNVQRERGIIMKKLVSLIMSCVMVLSLSVSAFAADVPSNCYVHSRVMSAEETVEMFGDPLLRMTRTGSVLLQKNTNGNQGVACGMFTADTESVSFRFTSAPTAKTYNIILHEGSTYNQGTQVGAPTEDAPINNGTSFYDLNIGSTYYFVVSSDDVDGYTTAKYEIKTF